MRSTILLGAGRWMIPIPRAVWHNILPWVAARQAARDLARLSDDHHRVRDFVVREMHRVGEPLTPEVIARELSLPVKRVKIILDDLERGKMYLYRLDTEAVNWAYPVTADETPHRVTYSTGEEGFAA